VKLFEQELNSYMLIKLVLVFATFSFKYTMYLFHALIVFLKNWV